MRIAGLQWDAGNWPKCGKHGVSKADIELVLRYGRVAPDPRQSSIEDRFLAVGRNHDGRPIFVGFTYRRVETEVYLRPLTARYMHKKEADRYGAQGSKDEDG